DLSRRRPANRIPELFRDEPQIEPELKRVPLHAAEALREGFCVAVLAARADLRAATDGIPRRIGPLDLGGGTHGLKVFMCSLTVNQRPILGHADLGGSTGRLRSACASAEGPFPGLLMRFSD